MSKKKEKTTSNNLNIGYSGKIKLDVVKGTKVIKSKTYSNTGSWPMFYFLGLCLSGEYSKAEKYRPKYIRLFSAGAENDEPPSDEGITNIIFNNDNITSLNIITYNQTPYTTKDEGGGTNISSGKAEVTFKFIIPFTQIDVNKPTNMFVLYDQANRNTLSKPSAYFILLKGEDDVNAGKLDNVLLDSDLITNDFNLFIQWTITIQNQL